LGTTDRKLAKELALPHVAHWKAEFRRLRAAIAKGLTPEMIEADLKSFYQSLPQEEPFVMPDGSVEWGVVNREAETASHAYDHYEPDPLDQKQVNDLKVAVGVATGSIVRLADYIEGWRESSDATAKTLDVAERDVRDLAEQFKTMDNVTRPAVQKYLREKLGHLSLATQKRKASAWRGFWYHLMTELEVEEPRKPFDDLFPKAKTKASRKPQTARAAFSVSDVELLYRSAENDLKLLIKIAAYTGMRIEEICSKSSITDNGKWLTIVDAKTEAGNRRVPIHQTLIDDGTLEDWFANVRPRLKPNKHGNYSDAIGKRFGRLKTRLDFGRDLVFHSLRHTVATQLKAKYPSYGVVINELLGHQKPKDQSFGLYAKQTDEYKVELINSLSYSLPR
jgi:integrase